MARKDDLEKVAAEAELVERPAAAEPPVVARLVVEIRSDGSRTIARGAMEDLQLGQKVAIEAEGRTPLQLAGALARALLRLPSLRVGRTLARALLKKPEK